MTKEEAKEAYRAAWAGWVLSTDPEEKLKLEFAMDSLQPFITRGPGPEWQAFAETLPGFLEFWKRGYLETVAAFEAKGP